MTSWKDLEFAEVETKPVDYDNIPEERGGGGLAPLIQPGTYTFQLPQNLETLWGKMMAQVGERAKLEFKGDNPLVVVKASKSHLVGEGWFGNISALELNIAPFGEPEFLFSDLGRLLIVLGSKEKVRNGDNKTFIKEMNKFGGAQFTADNDWSVTLRSSKGQVRRIKDPESGRSIEDPSGKVVPDFKAVTYKSKHALIPKFSEGDQIGQYQEEFELNDAVVEDGVITSPPTLVRCFQNLRRFRAVQ